jgi:hypothetical protein
MSDQTEPRNKTVSLTVTATEREAITLVAKARGMSESEVLRTMTLDQIAAEGAVIEAAMKQAVA